MRSLAWKDVHRHRAERSFLAEAAPRERLLDVVGAVCGIHAQVATAAELSISARVPGVTRDDIRAALWTDRTLVKTSSLRGTLHIHPAHELALWMAARRVRPEWEDDRWLAGRGMRREQLGTILDAIADALDGRALTFAELGDEVVRRAGRWAGRSLPWVKFGHAAPVWTDFIGVAAHTGRLCYGPNRGRNVTFVRADQWVSGWNDLEPMEALTEVVRRYLRAYGPATTADFVHWFYVPHDVAASAFVALAGELEEVDVAGYRAWMLASDADDATRAALPPRLLPNYDCYVIGAAPVGTQRERLIPAPAGRRVFDRGAGPHPVVLIGGVVAGLWERRDLGTRHMKIRVESLRRLNAAERRELEREARRVGALFGREAALTLVEP
ncbi:MAG: winged helix DNA-binding domain-containing protein [Candidatus Limnocylindria bacterium]